MLKVGITGGIGSGKTTVAKIFEVLGIPVYDADAASKRLMNTDGGLMKSIRDNFGEQAYNAEGLDRAYIAAIVFNNPEKLALLNSIVHPPTIADADDWLNSQTTPYTIKEAALLFESGSYKHLDKVIGVFSPLELRIERVMSRDNITREQVQARIDKQMPDNEKMRLCDYVITNDDTQLVIPQVLKLHEQFLEMSKKSITLK